jgi:hypothetical protein
VPLDPAQRAGLAGHPPVKSYLHFSLDIVNNIAVKEKGVVLDNLTLL